MPLQKGKSMRTFKENMMELLHGGMSAARTKAVHTIAQKSGISMKKARQKQAIAIAYAQKRKGKSKK